MKIGDLPINTVYICIDNSYSSYIVLMEITMLSKHSIDLTGQRFGSLVAIAPKYKEADMWYWEFKCDCGNTHIARGNTIKHQAKKQKEGVPS